MPIVFEGGAGGFPRARAAAIALSGSAAGIAGVIPFDTVDFDTDGFFSAADHGFKIPAGLDGAYLFSVTLAVTDDASLTALAVQLGFGAEPILFSPAAVVPRTAAAGVEAVSLSAVGRFAVADVVTATASPNGVASVTIQTTTTFSIVYLGSLT